MVPSSFISSLLCWLHCKKRKSRVYTEIPVALQAFETDLAESFQELLTQAGESMSSFVSLSWLCRAVNMLLSTQACVQELVSCLQSPLSVREIKMIQQYMDDSVKLLDVCRLLREVMGGVDGYVKAVQLALSYLCCEQGLRSERRAMLRARKALISAEHVRANLGEASSIGHAQYVRRPHDRLGACSSMLRRMGDKLMAPDEHAGHYEDAPNFSSSSSAFLAALYGGEMATLFVFKLLAVALPASTNPSRSQLGPLHVLGRTSWADALHTLQAKVNKELLERVHKKAQGSMTLLPDLDVIDGSVKQINEMLRQTLEQSQSQDALSRLVDSTSKRVEGLQAFMATLQHQIEGLFRSMVDTRMSLLDSVTTTGLHV